ncbi:MAG: hypothetical protein WBD51_23300 [Burkholderiaceae bacterium]
MSEPVSESGPEYSFGSFGRFWPVSHEPALFTGQADQGAGPQNVVTSGIYKAVYLQSCISALTPIGRLLEFRLGKPISSAHFDRQQTHHQGEGSKL